MSDEKDKLLDPRMNELIPDDGPSHERDGTLLDPHVNELIPSDDGPTITPPELAPGYVEPPPKRVKAQMGGDLLSVITNLAEGGAHSCERERVEISPGLVASCCPSGGLSLFRGEKQIYSREDLTPEERKAMIDFWELHK